jgi:Holliday junction resolvase
LSEQKVQTKILKWLKDNGFYVFKTVVCNRNGIPDIVGCTPKGRFFAIEVKYGHNKASKLQEWNIAEINKRGGIAFVAYDLETVRGRLNEEH